MNLLVDRNIGKLASRSVPLLIELKFAEDRDDGTEMAARKSTVKTIIHVVIRLRRQKDSHYPKVDEQAYQLIQSLQSYLMARETGKSDE